MADIFISYRRADSEQWASHLCTTLKAVFGDDRVFLDERGGLEGAVVSLLPGVPSLSSQ